MQMSIALLITYAFVDFLAVAVAVDVDSQHKASEVQSSKI